MKHLSILFISFLCSTVFADDHRWFENEWISDRAATREAKPHVENLTKDVRERYLNMFGYLRWKVGDGFVSVIREGHPEYRSRYSITLLPTNQTQLEVTLIDLDKVETIMRVWRTDAGFCAKMVSITVTNLDGVPQKTSWEGMDEINTVECYKPYNSTQIQE